MKFMMNQMCKSLANRVTVTIIITLSLILSVVGAFEYRYIESSSLEALTEETTLLADAVSRDVQNIFENARITSAGLSYNNEIRRYLKEVEKREDIKGNSLFPSVLKTLQSIQDSNANYFLTWVANEKANFYLDNTEYISEPDYDVKKRPWFQVGKDATGTAFTQPYVEWLTKRIVISTITPLFEKDSRIGFVVVDIVLEDIPAIFDKARLDARDLSFLITGEGLYVYHPNSDKILTESYREMEDGLSPYSDLIESATGELVEVQYENKRYFLQAYGIEESDWRVVTLIDKDRISRRVYASALKLFGIFAIGILVSIIVVYVILRRSMRPFKFIVSNGRQISRGDYTLNMPDAYLKRTDEIGEIADSFQRIVDQFRNENLTLENRIEEKNQELEAQYAHIMSTERAASLGNLVAGITHEINTPIGTSLSTATFLEQEINRLRSKLEAGELTKKAFVSHLEIELESIGILTSSLDRAAELIKSFKQVAVDQSSEMNYAFDLRENFEAVIKSLRHEYKHTKHQIINNCPSGLKINSFPGAFSQVITNLIMNSLRHGFEGVEEGRIEIYAERDEADILITYSDNGIGMSQEILDKIFDPFFTTNRSAGNSGLGMHIVNTIIVEKLGGKLTCESTPGCGVLFTMRIPQ